MLVVLSSAIFLMFAFSFFKPQTARDWRTFGAFAAFIVALFPILIVMYGRLAVAEEAEMRAQFGETYEHYTLRTPRFIPALKQPSAAT